MIVTTYGNLTYDKNSAKFLACTISYYYTEDVTGYQHCSSEKVTCSEPQDQ